MSRIPLARAREVPACRKGRTWPAGGVYLIQGAIDNDNPNLIVDLVPRQTTSDGVASVSVPPSQVVDFDAP
jgi:hypothetical protein